MLNFVLLNMIGSQVQFYTTKNFESPSATLKISLNKSKKPLQTINYVLLLTQIFSGYFTINTLNN